MKEFYRQKQGETRKLLAEEKKGLFQEGCLPQRCSYQTDYLSFLGGMKRARMTDYLIAADQNIPDLPIKITFLEKVETAIRSGIKSRFAL